MPSISYYLQTALCRAGMHIWQWRRSFAGSGRQGFECDWCGKRRVTKARQASSAREAAEIAYWVGINLR